MTATLGPTTVDQGKTVEWLRQRGAHERMIAVVSLYFATCPRYNVPAEAAIVQAGKETAWGHYGGVVPPEFNNWCGLKRASGGDNNDPNAHQRFATPADGVLAHVQHLAKYGGQAVPVAGDALIDPRAHLVTLGSVPNLEDLGGKWAPSPTYGVEIAALRNALVSFAKREEQPMAAQIPGFRWQPADANHYDRGRSVKIRGGAQHYTGGTNSLPWLTTTSSPPVSATFLVKHNPTLEDRGWQLVRIEDTAWTTAFANAYTVSIEYEHLPSQEIPDIAYTVLAQTWIDISRYVAEHGLGSIALDRSGIRGHKEWINSPSYICPDGIQLDRITDRISDLLGSGGSAQCLYFAETGHYLCHGFRGFWEKNGGLAIFGFPLTEEYKDASGTTVQWFERARFEHRPDIAQNEYGVVLGLIGSEHYRPTVGP